MITPENANQEVLNAAMILGAQADAETLRPLATVILAECIDDLDESVIDDAIRIFDEIMTGSTHEVSQHIVMDYMESVDLV